MLLQNGRCFAKARYLALPIGIPNYQKLWHTTSVGALCKRARLETRTLGFLRFEGGCAGNHLSNL